MSVSAVLRPRIMGAVSWGLEYKVSSGSRDEVASRGLTIESEVSGPRSDWPLSPTVVSVFAVDASFRVRLATNPGDAADNHPFLH